MPSMMKQARRKIDSALCSPSVAGTVSRLITSHLRKRLEGTRWIRDGQEALAEHVQAGNGVIMVLWHGRLPAAPIGWDTDWGKLCVVTSAAIPGRMVGRVMGQFGHDTIPMRERKANTGTSLQIARMVRGGTSIGFAADGPLGPARKAKSVPIDWARLTGAQIWLFTASYRNYSCVKAWDRMALPISGDEGVMLYRRWDAEIPKKLDADLRETLRQRLEDDLNALTLEADQRMGHETLIN